MFLLIIVIFTIISQEHKNTEELKLYQGQAKYLYLQLLKTVDDKCLWI